MIEFFKYEGAGNDFILIDDRSALFPLNDAGLIAKMCDRHFGIGADGLMLLQDHADFDFKMVYFNSDGNESSMCGNGGRCITQFAQDIGIVESQARFIAIDGPHKASNVGEGVIELSMSDVSNLEHLGKDATLLDTGSPHLVIKSEDLEALDLVSESRKHRYNDRFSREGVNVNFIQKVENGLRIRTYERGVEDETLACGTGVTAAAIAAFDWGWTNEKVSIQAKGGDLSVSFEKNDSGFKNIRKTGPAKFVFKGWYLK